MLSSRAETCNLAQQQEQRNAKSGGERAVREETSRSSRSLTNDLWIGYQSGGPSFLENGHIRNFSEAEGLPSTHNFEMAMREIAGMM
jgi:hypothetical protein